MDVHAIRKKINYLTFGILWYLILTDNISKCVDRLIPHLMTNRTGKYIDNGRRRRPRARAGSGGSPCSGRAGRR